jgi:predicted transposase YbfD/YdcC
MKRLHRSSSASTSATPSVRLASSKEDQAWFDAQLDCFHDLGPTTPIGDFLRQIVEIDSKPVALLAWVPACYALKDRDRWISWSAPQRVARLKLIVQNRRLLILSPKGAAPNLASQAMGAALRALPVQWLEVFGYQPLLAESFTDPEDYAGTTYTATNWQLLGTTQGYARSRLDDHRRRTALPAQDRPDHRRERRRLSPAGQRQPTPSGETGPEKGVDLGRPLFEESQVGHGRVDNRALHHFATDGMAMDFPFARSLMVVRSRRTEKRSGKSTVETRCYISSLEPEDRTPEQWLQLIRGHWAGFENRNHWRRDALMGEDRSRSRNRSFLTNLALIRNGLFRVLNRCFPGDSIPVIRERIQAKPCLAFRALEA